MNNKVEATRTYLNQGLLRGNNQDWSSYFPTQPQEIERIVPDPDHTILLIYFIDIDVFETYPKFNRLKFPMLGPYGIPDLENNVIGFKSLADIEDFLNNKDVAKYKISSCSCKCGCN